MCQRTFCKGMSISVMNWFSWKGKHVLLCGLHDTCLCSKHLTPHNCAINAAASSTLHSKIQNSLFIFAPINLASLCL
jgi:hypothetical protein